MSVQRTLLWGTVGALAGFAVTGMLFASGLFPGNTPAWSDEAESHTQGLVVGPDKPIVVMIPEKGVKAEIKPERILLTYGNSTISMNADGLALVSEQPIIIRTPNVAIEPNGDLRLSTSGTFRVEAHEIELESRGEVSLEAPEVDWQATGRPLLSAPAGLEVDTGSNDLQLDADDILIEAHELNADIGYEVEIDAGSHFSLEASSDIITDAYRTEIRGSTVRLAGGDKPVARVGSRVTVPPAGIGEVTEGSRRVYVP